MNSKETLDRTQLAGPETNWLERLPDMQFRLQVLTPIVVYMHHGPARNLRDMLANLRWDERGDLWDIATGEVHSQYNEVFRELERRGILHIGLKSEITRAFELWVKAEDTNECTPTSDQLLSNLKGLVKLWGESLTLCQSTDGSRIMMTPDGEITYYVAPSTSKWMAPSWMAHG